MARPKPAKNRMQYSKEEDWIIANHAYWVWNIIGEFFDLPHGYAEDQKIERINALLQYDFKRLNE